MLESELLSAEDLALIQSLEPKTQKPQVIPKVGWNHYNGVPDGSVSINTYTDCETEYGNLTIKVLQGGNIREGTALGRKYTLAMMIS